MTDLYTNTSSIREGTVLTEDSVYETKRGFKSKKPKGSLICCQCSTLLAKPNGDGEIKGQIKCGKCGVINQV